MEEILHQLRLVFYPIIFQGFIHPRWLAVSWISSINRSLPKIPSQEMGYLLPAPPNQPSSVGGFRRAGQIPLKSGGNLAKITLEFCVMPTFFADTCHYISLANCHFANKSVMFCGIFVFGVVILTVSTAFNTPTGADYERQNLSAMWLLEVPTVPIVEARLV